MRRICVIAGATATGKTALAVLIAKALGGEVVSADSMQVYRRMDIGTAKPGADEMDGVIHHMISVCEPFENYSVSRYVNEAAVCADGILSRGRLPVIVGGTGLYIDSLLRGVGLPPAAADGKLRKLLEGEYDDLGGEKMLSRLAKADPARAALLSPNDKRRIVRALEVFQLTGETITAHDERSRKAPPRYEARKITLNFSDRGRLYDRINARVDKMLENGLLREVRGLLDEGVSRACTAMQAIGYKETAAALEGEMPVGEAIEAIKLESRRYAKRQETWFRRYDGALRISWGETPDFSAVLRDSTKFILSSN